MTNSFDGFPDVIGGSAGIFDHNSASVAGQHGGLSAHDTPQTNATKFGVAVLMACRGCGRPAQLMIEYPELICVQYNAFPQNVWAALAQVGQPAPVQDQTYWDYSAPNGGMYPMKECGWCRTPLVPIFTPEEAAAHVTKAYQAGWLKEGPAKQLANFAYQVAQQQPVGR
jgi:hypothetical protein